MFEPRYYIFCYLEFIDENGRYFVFIKEWFVKGYWKLIPINREYMFDARILVDANTLQALAKVRTFTCHHHETKSWSILVQSWSRISHRHRLLHLLLILVPRGLPSPPPLDSSFIRYHWLLPPVFFLKLVEY